MCVWKNENKWKKAGVGPYLKKTISVTEACFSGTKFREKSSERGTALCTSRRLRPSATVKDFISDDQNRSKQAKGWFRTFFFDLSDFFENFFLIYFVIRYNILIW